MKFLLNIIFFAIYITFGTKYTLASPKPIPATIVNITEINNQNASGSSQWLELKSSNQNQTIFIKNERSEYFKFTEYRAGDKLMIQTNEGSESYQIADYFRQDSLAVLFWIFVFVVVIIGRAYGLTSLFGMAVSLFFIVKVILPQIGTGANPILVVLLSSIFLIPVTFYLSHGVNTKTNIAIVGTFISALITGILAYVFTHESHLTGFANEEASFLDLAKNGTINIQSLLISGILIGSIGILDDVSVSQVSVVNEIHLANPKLTFIQLFTNSMRVGRDHVASMVNTLFLVYTGAAMPLMLLFLDNSLTFSQIINTEIVAEEVVRTLVASIGLILAVPTTTLMAAKFYAKKPN